MLQKKPQMGVSLIDDLKRNSAAIFLIFAAHASRHLMVVKSFGISDFVRVRHQRKNSITNIKIPFHAEAQQIL